LTETEKSIVPSSAFKIKNRTVQRRGSKESREIWGRKMRRWKERDGEKAGREEERQRKRERARELFTDPGSLQDIGSNQAEVCSI
jgi:hypothetical protein